MLRQTLSTMCPSSSVLWQAPQAAWQAKIAGIDKANVIDRFLERRRASQLRVGRGLFTGGVFPEIRKRWLNVCEALEMLELRVALGDSCWH